MSGWATHLKTEPGDKAACGRQLTAGAFRTTIPDRMVGRDGKPLDRDGIIMATRRIVTCRPCRAKLPETEGTCSK